MKRLLSSVLIMAMVITMLPMPAMATEGEVVEQSCSHVWEETTCTAPKTCSVCGVTDGETADHSWIDATCKAPKTCSMCGATDGETADHSWVDATCKAPKTCSVCGAMEGEALCHEEIQHEAKEPTCAEVGWDAYVTCSRCDYSTYVEKSKLRHTEVADEAVVATCTATGLTVGTHCSVCNAVLTAQTEVAALGHNYVDGKCSVCGVSQELCPHKLEGDCDSCTAIAAVEAEIEKLPTEEEMLAKDNDGRNAIYTELNRVTELYYALPETDQAFVENVQKMIDLHYAFTELQSTTPDMSEEIGGSCGSSATWVLSNDGALIISGSGQMYSYSNDNLPWNDYRDQVLSVVIEDGITVISGNAFSNCTNLKTVTIASSVTKIFSGILQYCTSLETVTFLGDAPSMDIGGFVFKNASTVAIYPAYNSTYSAEFMSQCGRGGNVAWRDSEGNLASGTCGTNLKWKLNSGDLVIFGTGTMTDFYEYGPWYSYKNSIQSVELSDGVSSIGYGAFNGCSNLVSTTIPNSVTRIAGFAFTNCTNLASVSIPNSVETIEEASFRGCAGLTTITFPSGVTAIWDEAFNYCSSLTSIIFEGDAPSFGIDGGSGIFSGVTATVKYPANNTTWTLDVIQNYGGMLTWVAVGDSDDSDIAINEANFPDEIFRAYVSDNFDKDCDGVLSKAEWEAVTSISVSNTGISSMEGVGFFNKLQSLHCGSNQLTSLDISTCTELTYLSCNDSLLTALDISACTELTYLSCAGNQITSLDVTKCTALGRLYCESNQLTDLDISKCTALQTLWCHDNQLTSLDVSSCTALHWLDCENNQLTALDVSKCTALSVLECEGNTYDVSSDSNGIVDLNTLPGDFDVTKASGWTGGSVEGMVLTVDADATEVTYTYDCGNTQATTFTLNIRRSEHVHDFANGTCFCGLVGGVCGDGLTWTLGDGGVLTISGEGAIDDFLLTTSPWYTHRQKINSVVIQKGVKSIGKAAFAYLDGITAVEIPESVENISESAFEDCSQLANVDIPSGVESIGRYAFKGCTNITGEVVFKSGLKSIDYGAFAGNTGITAVTIPESVSGVDGGAFKGCSTLASISVDESNENYCALDGVLFSKDMTQLVKYPPAKKSECYTIPETVTSIGAYAFTDFTGGSVAFSGSAPTIDSVAFYNSASVTAYYPYGDDNWASDVMQNYGGVLTWKVDRPGLWVEELVASAPVIEVGESVTLTAVTGGEGEIANVEFWIIKPNGSEGSDGKKLKYVFYPMEPGVHTCFVKLTDTEGNTSTKYFQLTVEGTNATTNMNLVCDRGDHSDNPIYNVGETVTFTLLAPNNAKIQSVKYTIHDYYSRYNGKEQIVLEDVGTSATFIPTYGSRFGCRATVTFENGDTWEESVPFYVNDPSCLLEDIVPSRSTVTLGETVYISSIVSGTEKPTKVTYYILNEGTSNTSTLLHDGSDLSIPYVTESTGWNWVNVVVTVSNGTTYTQDCAFYVVDATIVGKDTCVLERIDASKSVGKVGDAITITPVLNGSGVYRSMEWYYVIRDEWGDSIETSNHVDITGKTNFDFVPTKTGTYSVVVVFVDISGMEHRVSKEIKVSEDGIEENLPIHPIGFTLSKTSISAGETVGFEIESVGVGEYVQVQFELQRLPGGSDGYGISYCGTETSGTLSPQYGGYYIAYGSLVNDQGETYYLKGYTPYLEWDLVVEDGAYVTDLQFSHDYAVAGMPITITPTFTDASEIVSVDYEFVFRGNAYGEADRVYRLNDQPVSSVDWNASFLTGNYTCYAIATNSRGGTSICEKNIEVKEESLALTSLELENLSGMVNQPITATAEISGEGTIRSAVYDVYYKDSESAEEKLIDTITGKETKVTYTPDVAGMYCIELKLTSGRGVPYSKTSEWCTVTSDSIPIDAAHFPDSNFRSYIKEKFDTNNDAMLDDVELNAVLEINVGSDDTVGSVSKNITSLEGIQYFKNITRLYCGYNPLRSLDVSNNLYLKELLCWGCRLTDLDVSKNTVLEELHCSKNQLTALDVSNNPKLRVLSFYENNVSSLDVSNNPELVNISCSKNKLTALDVSNNPKLVILSCSDNQIPTLNLSNNPALENLSCINNKLTSLDTTQNPKLWILDAAGNDITALDLSSNPQLQTLNVYGCGLSRLDLSNNLKIWYLNASNNLLETLDISNLTALQNVYCENNKLTSLDTSKNKSLVWLKIGGNQVTSLDLSANAKLEHFEYENNSYVIQPKGHKFDLQTLPGSFNVNQASNWIGGSVDGYILTVDASTGKVTYTYDCGDGKIANFTLVVQHALTGVEPGKTLEIDGKKYSANENGTIWLKGTDDRIVASFTSGMSDLKDPHGIAAHQQYPTSMEVHFLRYDETSGTYIMEKIAPLTNILTYRGTSIRMTGNQGIRIFTSISESKRNALVDGSLLQGTPMVGYKLVEYGTLFGWASNGTDLVYNANVTGNRSVAYNSGRDSIFTRQNGEIWYTGMLVNLKVELCDDELLLRPYMVLQNAQGEQIVIHGGTLQRNIGYVAYQNKDYKPNQEAQDFIWNIIKTVYGDKVQK